MSALPDFVPSQEAIKWLDQRREVLEAYLPGEQTSLQSPSSVTLVDLVNQYCYPDCSLKRVTQIFRDLSPCFIHYLARRYELEGDGMEIALSLPVLQRTIASINSLTLFDIPMPQEMCCPLMLLDIEGLYVGIATRFFGQLKEPTTNAWCMRIVLAERPHGLAEKFWMIERFWTEGHDLLNHEKSNQYLTERMNWKTIRVLWSGSKNELFANVQYLRDC
jgi:hypothetical protein